jgi:hypothetical protein
MYTSYATDIDTIPAGPQAPTAAHLQRCHCAFQLLHQCCEAGPHVWVKVAARVAQHQQLSGQLPWQQRLQLLISYTHRDLQQQ